MFKVTVTINPDHHRYKELYQNKLVFEMSKQISLDALRKVNVGFKPEYTYFSCVKYELEHAYYMHGKLVIDEEKNEDNNKDTNELFYNLITKKNDVNEYSNE